MNHKFNSTSRSRAHAARTGIPVRFELNAMFDVKIKNSHRNGILNLDPPLVPELDRFQARANGRERLKTLLAPFNRKHTIAAVTLMDERHLNQRRLEAVIRGARKKRC